ncbi:MAG: hypothetical protein GY799_28835 [Desulfobulbaceae bacterium]|nr:hypothetical protein [Desulfobulbaceae bacterium]
MTMSMSMTIRKLVLIGYENGYEAEHNDTVENAYCDAHESGVDWLNDATEDGTITHDMETM